MRDFHTVPVTAENAAGFVQYCRAHGAEHDESFLPQNDFVPGAEYPAYLLETGRASAGETTGSTPVLGAACLIRKPGDVEKRFARFMILHAAQPSRDAYAALLAAIRPQLADLDYAFGFIPEQLTAVRRIWEELGLRVERYAYVLEHPGGAAPSVELPAGCHWSEVQRSDRAGLATFAKLLNLSFAGHPQRSDVTAEHLAQDAAGPYGLPGGLVLLWCEGRPVATVRIERDEEPGAAGIGGVTVHPDYRGRGLGRLLIGKALAVAHANRLQPVYLSVAPDNEAAIRLYTSQGFHKTEAMVCYRWQPGAP